MRRSRRFTLLAERDINKETFVEPWPEAGLIVTDSPHAPQPGLRLDPATNQVVELDGKPRAQFDTLDFFIADHGIDLSVAAKPWPRPLRISPACWPISTCRQPRYAG